MNDRSLPLRPYQTKAVKAAVEAFDHGKKVVFLDGPTGVGKTWIAEAIRREMMARKTIYLCSTVGLQSQFTRDFGPYGSPGGPAVMLMGKSRYPVGLPDKWPGLTADDCIGEGCPWCGRTCAWSDDLVKSLDAIGVTSKKCTKMVTRPGSIWCDEHEKQHIAELQSALEDHKLITSLGIEAPAPVSHAGEKVCPYQMAVEMAKKADVACLSYSAWLSRLHRSRDGGFDNRNLLICDEGDMLESFLIGFVGVELSHRLLSDIRARQAPADGLLTESNWHRWLKDTAKLLELTIDRLRNQIQQSRSAASITIRRQYRTMDAMFWKMRELIDGRGDPSRFVGSASNGTVSIRPMNVRGMVNRLLWSHGSKFLVMSATMCGVSELAWSLDVDSADYDIVRVPHQVPIAQRRVHYWAAAKMGRNGPADRVEKMADRISKIRRMHAGSRILVHTVSRKLASDLVAMVPGAFDYGTTGRDSALKRFLDTPASDTPVLLAPSMDRGVDLAGEKCRVVIVAKMPYGNLGDLMTKMRRESTGGEDWYALETIRTLVQMTGRAVRGINDWSHTYILDGDFGWFYKQHRSKFPIWWTDAVLTKR